MKTLLLCLMNTGLMVVGQILFKIGSKGKEINSLLDMIELIFTPLILCALCVYAGATALWLYILSRTPISYAYPIQALAFPIVLLLSAFIFHEEISFARWLGVFIIVIGVVVSTRG